MKLQRYYSQGFGESDDGDICWSEDVAYLETRYEELEAKCAKLLEALKEIFEQTDGRNHSMNGQDRAHSIARNAIAKAERGSDEKDTLKDLEEKKS